MGGGLKRVLKVCGELKVTGRDKTVEYVWDYANDVATTREAMPVGSDRWCASERAKYQQKRREETKDDSF